MFTLIIETSTDKSLVVFAYGGKPLLNLFLPPSAQSSGCLLPLIVSGFQKLNETPQALSAIAIGIGPGSYTGLRVGAAVGLGLAFPTSIPLISFCSLEGFISDQEGPFSSIIDARMGGSYLLQQEKIQGQIILKNSPQFILKENLEVYTKDYPIKAGPHIHYPDPEHLANITAYKLANKEQKGHIELIYLRTPEYLPSQR